MLRQKVVRGDTPHHTTLLTSKEDIVSVLTGKYFDVCPLKLLTFSIVCYAEWSKGCCLKSVLDSIDTHYVFLIDLTSNLPHDWIVDVFNITESHLPLVINYTVLTEGVKKQVYYQYRKNIASIRNNPKELYAFFSHLYSVKHIATLHSLMSIMQLSPSTPQVKSYTLIWFSAFNCPPCSRIKQAYHHLAKHIAEQDSFILTTLYVQQERSKPLVNLFNIRLFPTFILLENKITEEFSKTTHQLTVNIAGVPGLIPHNEYTLEPIHADVLLNHSGTTCFVSSIQHSDWKLLALFIDKHCCITLSMDEDF